MLYFKIWILNGTCKLQISKTFYSALRLHNIWHVFKIKLLTFPPQQTRFFYIKRNCAFMKNNATIGTVNVALLFDFNCAYAESIVADITAPKISDSTNHAVHVTTDGLAFRQLAVPSGWRQSYPIALNITSCKSAQTVSLQLVVGNIGRLNLARVRRNLNFFCGLAETLQGQARIAGLDFQINCYRRTNFEAI
jgi:hypothetical protein